MNKLPTGRRRCAVTKKYKGDTKYTKTITSLAELNRSCMLSLNYCLMLFFFMKRCIVTDCKAEVVNLGRHIHLCHPEASPIPRGQKGRKQK